WKTIATLRRGTLTRVPSMSTLPSSRGTRPCIARSSVVFPHPDGPRTQSVSPSRTASSSRSNTVIAAYRFVARSTTIRSVLARSPQRAEQEEIVRGEDRGRTGGEHALRGRIPRRFGVRLRLDHELGGRGEPMSAQGVAEPGGAFRAGGRRERTCDVADASMS